MTGEQTDVSKVCGEGSGVMDEAGFHPELAELLEDPITHHVMASDRVEMASLVALLRTARRHLRRERMGESPRRQ